MPPILQLTLFNPLDDYYGLSPLEAAAVAVDTHNAAARWNKALLDNAARPSGALVYDGPEGAVMSDAQFERLKKELADQYQGTANAGRPLLLGRRARLEGDVASPKDMDFMEAKHSAAREIALAFGVPPMLLAIPGDNTYSNYQEANRVFWRQTVLPLGNRIGAALTQWLAPAFGAGLDAHRRHRPHRGVVSPTAPRCGIASPRRRSSPSTRNARRPATARCKAATGWNRRPRC